MPVDVQATVKNWKDGMSRSKDKYVRKINAVTESPMEAAAREKDRYIQGVQDNADKWASQLRRVPLSVWKANTAGHGAQRWAAVTQAAEAKYAQEMGNFLAYQDQGVSMVRQMPKGGEANSAARMLTMMRHNMAYKKS